VNAVITEVIFDQSSAVFPVPARRRVVAPAAGRVTNSDAQSGFPLHSIQPVVQLLGSGAVRQPVRSACQHHGGQTSATRYPATYRLRPPGHHDCCGSV